MIRFVITLVLIFCSVQPANAESIRLGDLLQRYREKGTALIYSTGLVDESKIVDWDNRLNIESLKKVLASAGLDLNQVNGGAWSIERKRTIIPDAKLRTRETPAFRPDTIDHIIVTASRYEVSRGDLSSYQLINETRLNDSPSFAGDSLRIIHRLPGAASIGISAKPNIRGGAIDELLVLFDGIELIEPFHLRDFQSMFSSFNPQTIQNIEYFTGGFPAQYGNKLSGVLDIATQDTFTGPGGELGISAFSTSALLFTESGANQWLFSARRGNLDKVLNLVNPGLGDPKYHDFYGRYVRQLSAGRIKFSGLSFNDDIRFESDESRATSKVDNRYVWLEWEMEPSERFYIRTFLSFASIESLRTDETFAEDSTEGFLSDNQSLSITSLKHLQEFRVHDGLKFSYGFSIQHLEMDYDTKVEVQRGTIALLLGLATDLNDAVIAKFEGSASSAFVTGKYRPLNSLTLQLGVRYDRQDYANTGSESQLSPRISMLFEPKQGWHFRFSYGRFYQPQGIYELQTTDLEIEFSKPQKSDHWILAVEYELDTNTGLEIELFYKRFDDLKPRYENLFNPYVFTPELEQDRILILSAKAFARGVELSYSRSRDSFEWNINYSYSQVQDKVDGHWVDRRWDQTHNLNAIGNWHLGNWDIGVAIAWHTGWTITEIPLEIPADEPFIVSNFRSNERLKNYATLDAKITYNISVKNTELSVFLEVTNLVNRSNKGGVDYEIALEDDLYLLEEVDVEPIFPLVANIGVIWRF